MILNAQECRHDPQKMSEAFANRNPFPIEIVLDNIYDTYNIGSIFRIADAINAQKVIITGSGAAKPPEKQIRKSSMNICDYMPWEYYENVQTYLKAKSIWQILICEKNRKSSDFNDFINYVDEKDKNFFVRFNKEYPLCIIVGNESVGVNPDIQGYVTLHIPMYGINFSMNVSNALSIIGHSIARCFDK